MRLFDKLMICPAVVSDPFRAIASQTVVVALDAIAEYVDEKTGESWSRCDFTCCRPPWEVFFVEWNTPRRAVEELSKRFTPSDANTIIQQFGWMCRSYMSPDQKLDLRRKLGEWAWLDDVTNTAIAQSPVCVLASAYFCERGQAYPMGASYLWFLGAEGDVSGERLFASDAPCGAMLESEIESCRMQSLIALLGLMFINCSNVKLEDVTEELQPEPKIRRRLKIPEVKRYTLNIAGHVARPSREYNEGPQGVMPFHLCRGHFATYTADKPMFGNPKLVGRYWHPPHMKGKKENGEIVKDYATQG